MDLISLPANVPPVASASPPSNPSTQVERPRHASFKEVLIGLGERMERGEASVQAALRGAPKLGPAGELLSLQAGVYQYTETFEVAAKMVDKATNAIRTTLQGQ
jgi:hypothetical protein